jgi:hypothetical protein
MKFYISAHPVDQKHQKELGIYSSGNVESDSIGRILSALVRKGHSNINSYYDKDNERIVFHCNAKEESK